MKKYRKKPVVIEAMKLTQKNIGITLSFVADSGAMNLTQTFDDGLIIPTKEGNMLASYGDWIIKGVAGEFCPCKPDIFEQTYEPVDED